MICPYCRESLGQGALACDACATEVHAECAALHGRCTTFACPGATFSTPRERRRSLAPALPPTVALRRAWSVALAIVLAPLDEGALLAYGFVGALAVALQVAAGS